MPAFVLRVPDHLGDGVMALPAVNAIAQLGSVQIIGPSWAARLYGQPIAVVPDTKTPHTAVLFKPSFSAAWALRHTPRRIGVPGDWRRWLLSEVVEEPIGHRRETYGALACAAGVKAQDIAPAPRFIPSAAEVSHAPQMQPEDVLLLPLSNSQATVGWPNFHALADGLGSRAVFAAGPGECDALAKIAGNHRRLPPLSLGVFSAVSAKVCAVVGNDSGLAHLAAAARLGAGLAPASVHVIFGSTTPQHTGPAGATAHSLDSLPCQPCYKKVCPLGQTQPPCLDTPATKLLELLR
jgi:ADP-heptose:LPS heptosyltransferase